ncbi:MAG: hypothetical protein IJY08_03255 [Clostridia bacterium]|nr:hypothetical protein [Clostridia bacterium]
MYRFEKATASAPYLLRNDGYEYSYDGVTPDELGKYRSWLRGSFYVEYDSADWDGNIFSTFVSSEEQINLAYYPRLSNGVLKIVTTRRGYLPPTVASEYQRITDATVTQIGRAGASRVAAGESFVIQLEDGSFVIIDGGPHNDADCAELLKFMCERKPVTHEKPRVVWLITHSHSDHVELPIDFLNENSGNIDLELFCWNNPIISASKESQCYDGGAERYEKHIADIEQILRDKYPGTKIFNCHTGQTLYLAGCKIEIIHTHEDIFPDWVWNLNVASTTFKFTFASGNTFLALGDSETNNCIFMVNAYGSMLDCDMVQVSHHGLNGATKEIYEKVKPTIAFWPIDKDRFENDEKCLGTRISPTTGKQSYYHNAYLRLICPQHYHSSETVSINTKDMSRKI